MKIKFGQMVTCAGFLERQVEFEPGTKDYKKVWRRRALKDLETCVAISMVTLSDGIREFLGLDEGFGWKPKSYFRALKVGRRRGGVRYVNLDDVSIDHLPFVGESICPVM